MKKQELIFSKVYHDRPDAFRYSDLPKELNDDDLIYFDKDEGFEGSVESWDAFSELKVYRMREMTDEEIEEYNAEMQKSIDQAKADRYKQYLRLAKEFK